MNGNDPVSRASPGEPETLGTGLYLHDMGGVITRPLCYRLQTHIFVFCWQISRVVGKFTSKEGAVLVKGEGLRQGKDISGMIKGTIIAMLKKE